jgi:hypothetical protein
MSRRMSLVWCVVAAVLVFASAGASRAEQMVYNANTDMVASETSGSPSPTFGQWTIGWADPLTLSGLVVIGDRPTYKLSGWGQADAGWAPYIYVNSLGGTNTLLPSMTPAKDEIGVHPGDGLTGGYYAFINWTAPRAGMVNIATTFESISNGTSATADVYIMKNYSWLVNGNIHAGNPTLAYNLTAIPVAANDIITVDVGNGADGNGSDHVGVFHAITYVPEPSSMAILGSALIGMLAYAWRKNK